jgi:tetratricopeptide (TPR) repeat protein
MIVDAPPTPRAALSRAPWCCVGLIVVAIIIAYHNSLQGPFIFDDASSIVTNPTIQRLAALGDVLSGPQSNVTAQGRPLLNLSLAINYALHGTSVRGYHITNLLIHALAATVLFGLIRRTIVLNEAARCVPPPQHAATFALIVAVLWAVHPLQTESVTYIIQRAESLVGLFYLLTLYCFVRSVPRASACRFDQSSPETGGLKPAVLSSRWQIACVLSCLGGMATKEVMVTAPLMLLFFDRTFFAGSFGGALRARPRFYAALACTWLVLAWLVAQTGGNRGGSVGFGVGIAWWEYALTQFKALGHYLWLSVWPIPLVFEYGVFWIRSAAEIAWQLPCVLGLLIATLIALRRRAAAGFLGAWCFGILAPTSLAPGTTQMIVEHRMYLPLAGLLVLLVGVVYVVAASRRRAVALLGAAGAVAIGLTALTIRRNHDYRSDVALWSDTVAKRAENPLAHFMLGGAFERAGNDARAAASYERALALKPNFSIGHENYGELLLRQGRRAEAIAHFEAALELQPEYADAHANLGNALLAEGRVADAVRHLRRAATLAPDAAVTRYNLANALAAAGAAPDAIAEYEAALRLAPEMVEAHFNLGNVWLAHQQVQRAITCYEAAVKARPGYAVAHYNLGNALAISGRPQDAAVQYEAALRARPDYAEAHHNLGSAYFELGRFPDAATHYAEALRIDPNFPNARANLERVRAQMRK